MSSWRNRFKQLRSTIILVSSINLLPSCQSFMNCEFFWFPSSLFKAHSGHRNIESPHILFYSPHTFFVWGLTLFLLLHPHFLIFFFKSTSGIGSFNYFKVFSLSSLEKFSMLFLRFSYFL